MRCTWALSAPPQPATASFTWFGVYCTTSQPAAAASARARPLACPTLMAVRTLTWKKTCSTATTSGRTSAMREASSPRSSASRDGSGSDGAVRKTPRATARAEPGREDSTAA